MPSKEFLCKTCGDMHKRPINSKCPFVDVHVASESEVDKSIIASGGLEQSDNNDLNLQILAELKSLGGRMTAMEQKMMETDSTEVTSDSCVTCSCFTRPVGPSGGTISGSVARGVTHSS